MLMPLLEVITAALSQGMVGLYHDTILLFFKLQSRDMAQRNSTNADNILTIQQMINKAGDAHRYQLRQLVSFFLVFLCSSFIQMGFPIIFQPAKFQCGQGELCTEQDQCAKESFALSPDIKSVAYSFQLVCDRKRYLRTCFEAFLYGGFIGSLYYGEIIERKGRKYALIESMIMMVSGLLLSLVSGSAVLFSFGVFFFNFGFRGFYNTSLLSITEVSNAVGRSYTPMLLSIGWALGQIIIGFICMLIFNWRIIFLITVLPLSYLLYFIYMNTFDSPRFLVTKHEFKEAKFVVERIAMINQRKMKGYLLKQEIEYESKMQTYEQLLSGGNISSRQSHHSYASLFRYTSIRIRVIIIGILWSLISLSYFISAKSQLNPNKSYTFNVALAGFIQIIAYLISIITSINLGRVFVIKRLVGLAAIFHLSYYFIQPHDHHSSFAVVLIFLLDIAVRILMSIGNTFIAIYSIEVFPTTIRHFALGGLGFITKLMYMLSFIFDSFFTSRYINPNFIIGILFLGTIPLIAKLRQTKESGMKDNLSQDGNSLLMNETNIDIF